MKRVSKHSEDAVNERWGDGGGRRERVREREGWGEERVGGGER